jgi:hypothetical protein
VLLSTPTKVIGGGTFAASTTKAQNTAGAGLFAVSPFPRLLDQYAPSAILKLKNRKTENPAEF